MSLKATAARLKPTEDLPGKVEVGPEGGEFIDVVANAPIKLGKDWDALFERFGMEPGEFEVIDDTIRVSTWQQSKATEAGDRDVVNLYSYKAGFRRVDKDIISEAVIARWRRKFLKQTPTPVEDSQGSRTGASYVILVADPQIGKKGTEEAVANWRRGIYGHIQRIQELLYFGVALRDIVLVFMGDEHENVVNSYGNQPHTIELNRSGQLELDFDMRVWTISELLKVGLPIKCGSVISNHGLWTRNGGKDVVTTNNDNSSTHISRLVQRLFDSLEEHTGQHIDWTIGDAAPGIVIDTGGVLSYFTHGFIEKGKGPTQEVRMKSAIERQILGRIEEYKDVKVWFAAHFHHFYAQEFEGKTLWGCPALEMEQSSEYMLDQYGVWSPAGMLGMMVGAHNSRGWSDVNVY
jgi:hypothetical protein